MIPAGASNAVIAIVPVNDHVPEGDETVIVSVQPNVGYIVSSQSSVSLTIQDAPYDAWLLTHFQNSELANPAISGDNADPDGDGFPNLLEYAFNADPKLPTTNSFLSGAMENSPNGVRFVVKFTRRKSPNELTYTVETSSDLVHWTSGPNVTTELRPPIDDGNGVTETARFQVFNFTPTRFVRLRISRQ
jgi:hypothetical protein